MKTEKGSSWPSLEKLPPSVVFQTLEFIQDGSKGGNEEKLKLLTSMVEQVEQYVRVDLRQFVEPPPGSKGATAAEVRRIVLGVSAFISALEDGVLEYDLRVNGTSELLVRYLQSYADGLAKAKGVRAVFVAALDNALGTMRGETVEQRLRRSIKVASEEAPVFLGSFEQYADADAGVSE
jgi:hypothetical protein